ncbi:hypothetical protein [Kribbella caucasensis]|uniref:hypothetical protein n=1 Tax=Kribbella caucasensis TaxID=2512215 RepID=UPI0014152A0D|nr:hypothetical protein [Kribbella sp. VKM Ac-2527]
MMLSKVITTEVQVVRGWSIQPKRRIAVAMEEEAAGDVPVISNWISPYVRGSAVAHDGIMPWIGGTAQSRQSCA